MADNQCDRCGAHDAVVHLTQIVDDEMSTSHLCEECAAEQGLEPTPEAVNFPLTDFLAQMGEEQEESTANLGTCDFCGLSFQDFRDSGRLGCPQCYSTFEPHLRNLLRRIHGGTKHVGKVYLPPDPSATEMEKRLETLRRRLERAVASEDFERAAELRDEIRDLEPAT